MTDFVLQTERLTLREMIAEDLDFVAEMLADAEVMRFYPHTYSRQQASDWMLRQQARYDRDGHGLWLVERRADGTPVGQVGLCHQTIDGVVYPEVGYLVHRPFWRQGIASEAARAVRDYAFATLGKPRVISLIRPANIPSQRTALRIGMKPERLVQFCALEHILFSISASDRTPCVN